MIHQHPMMDVQLQLEADMREATRSRYFRIHEKADERNDMADTHVGRSIFDHLYTPFIKGLEEWVADKLAGGAGRRPRAVKMIEEFGDTDTLAYIFVHHLINSTLSLGDRGKQKGARKTRVVLTCAMAIHDELRMRYFAENRKPLLKKIVKDFQQRELPRRRRRELMVKQFNTQQLEWQAGGWGQRERLNLGLVLLDIFQRTTGLVEEYKVFEGVNSNVCVRFTPAMIEAIKERMEKSADVFTVFYPTVIPPKPWQNHALVGGAYYSDNVHPYRLVKDAKIKYLTELEGRDMGKILGAINRVQETAWRVNPVMVEVLDHVFGLDMDVKGLPTAEPRAVPAAPPGMENDEAVAAEYRKTCYMVHDMNRRMISKRISVLRTLAMANRFAEFDAIYFPHDVDYRGRMYPKVPFLNPQGPDYVKSLLEFAEGKPIETAEHEAYLAIAVANAWGQDKLPLDERVQWVEDNEVMLQEIAHDPKSDLRWLDADEPFMALRGAIEWLGLCQYGRGYVSHMPVHFDATCSGLQHYSALLRDAEGGFHVNLTGCPERQDIYQAVAEKATATLEVEAITCDMARIALSMVISRSLCKRPVMIVPYAGTFSSCMEYVNDHYRERAEGGEVLPMDLNEIRSKITPLVSKHVWAAISNTVIAAREAMDWITATARIASKGQEAPIQWTTPDGFVIQQAKYEEKAISVETYLDGGRRVQSRLVDYTAELDARKMAQTLSPNYIHSLDACHMRKAVNRADGMGMSFAMIHDSFGVHASDMPRFVEECIKPAFVEMYADGKNLVLFKKELEVTMDAKALAKVKKLPPVGTLDLNGVTDSQFFFS